MSGAATKGNPSLLHSRDRYRQPSVYMLASQKFGTLYIGVTRNLGRRVWEHKEDMLPGFTRRYGVKTLVYYEFHDTMYAAIAREKQMKEWRRAWKIELIELRNPEWRDLYSELAP